MWWGVGVILSIPVLLNVLPVMVDIYWIYTGLDKMIREKILVLSH
jgi:hypothetical protein